MARSLDNPLSATERQQRSRLLRDAGYRVTRCGFPVPEGAIGRLVAKGLLPIECTESDRELLDALAELVARIASLSDVKLESLAADTVLRARISESNARKLRGGSSLTAD